MHNATVSKSRDRQILTPNWGWILAVALAIYAVGGSFLYLQESFWADEMHSAWCALGQGSLVAERAREGNQLAPYFYLLWCLNRTVGFSEGLFRAPSFVAWLTMVALAARWLISRSPYGIVAVLGVVGCVALDPSQLFYATEARPYALSALAILISWMALARWLPNPAGADRDTQPTKEGVSQSRSMRSHGRWWLLWIASAVTACWLQPVCGLVCASQFAFSSWILVTDAHQSRKDRLRFLMALIGSALVMGLLMTPAFPVIASIWQRRIAWAAFAASYSFESLNSLLPFVTCACVACGCILHRAMFGGNDRLKSGISTHAITKDVAATSAIRMENQLWLSAWLIPLATVYLLTAFKIAPLMQPRFVYYAAFPLILWTLNQISNMRNARAVHIALMLLIGGIAIQQGAAAQWRFGRWKLVKRGEDWRGAIALIREQSHVDSRGSEYSGEGGRAGDRGSQIVACASYWIEGSQATAKAELSARFNEYLSLPLRSAYPLDSHLFKIVSLWNDPRTWSTEIGKALDQNAANALSPSQATSGDRKTIDWIVTRTSAEGLRRRMAIANLQAAQTYDFGGVQVARDVGFKEPR